MADAGEEVVTGKVENESDTTTNDPANDFKNTEFKVILLGTSGVGKTSLFMRIKEDKFYEDTRNLKTDQGFSMVLRDGKKEVEITLYDSAAGMERYEKTLTKDYYRDSLVALLVYSADRIESFRKLLSCIEEVNENAPEAIKLIVRNKIDLEDQTVRKEEVSAQLGHAGYTGSTALEQLETSALNGNGIKELLSKIRKIMLKKRSLPVIAGRNFDSFKVKPKDSEPNQCPCC